MASLTGRTIIGMLLCCGAAVGQSQLKEGTGSIAGRVTLGGKPAQGVILMLKESSADERRALNMLMKGSASAKATTDVEGRYRFNGLAPGLYEVAAFAPALYAGDDKSDSVTLGDGATVDDIDFSLSKGGVITGRITTKDGRPVIMEPVQALTVDQPKTEESSLRFFLGSSFTTDDRGVYRIYGLAPGRYRVSVGKSEGIFDAIGAALKRPDHPRTFYPGVTDEARAAVVDLSAGGEVSNIDIKLGEANKTYRATGRVVDADTNKPIPNVITSYRAIKADQSDLPLTGRGVPTSSAGGFQLEGLEPGQYAAFAFFGMDGPSDFYSDQVTFEVKHEDVSGLEIKAHRGVVIIGLAVIEGTSDPATLERLGQAEIFASVRSEAGAPGFARAKVSSDGTFQLRGMRPGRAQIHLQELSDLLRIKRVERNGVSQAKGIEIAPGDQITDLRVVIGYASGLIRGQVNVEGAPLPKEARLSVNVLHKTDSSDTSGDPYDRFERAAVDPAGRFVIEGLIPGEYEVTLTALLNPSAPAAMRQVRLFRQQVVVAGDSPTEMVFVLDLAKTSERD